MSSYCVFFFFFNDVHVRNESEYQVCTSYLTHELFCKRLHSNLKKRGGLSIKK